MLDLRVSILESNYKLAAVLGLVVSVVTYQLPVSLTVRAGQVRPSHQTLLAERSGPIISSHHHNQSTLTLNPVQS